MTDRILAALLPITYRQSDMAYRIGLLREFLEFAYFAQQRAVPDTEAITHFASTGAREAADIATLRRFQPEFFAAFNRDSFHQELDEALETAKRLPTLRLTVACLLPIEAVEEVGRWARETIGQESLLEFSVDASLAAGCQILWHDALHDYSFERRMQAHAQELETRLTAALVEGSAA